MFLMRRDVPTGSVLPQKYRSRVAWLSRYYLVLWAAYVYLFPETLLLHYAIVTGVWYLTTWRIPLEHRMERRVEASDLLIKLAGDRFADTAKKSQRYMKMLAVAPTRAVQPFLQGLEALSDIIRDRQPCKQSDHALNRQAKGPAIKTGPSPKSVSDALP